MYYVAHLWIDRRCMKFRELGWPFYEPPAGVYEVGVNARFSKWTNNLWNADKRESTVNYGAGDKRQPPVCQSQNHADRKYIAFCSKCQYTAQGTIHGYTGVIAKLQSNYTVMYNIRYICPSVIAASLIAITC